MRLMEVLLISMLLCLCSTVFAKSISSLRKMNMYLEEIKKENDSLYFITESFFLTCAKTKEEKGFSSLDEWMQVCRKMWNLNRIEWNLTGEDGNLICGSWSGPFGEGKAYYRRKDDE